MAEQGIFIPSADAFETRYLRMEQKFAKQKVIVLHSTKGGVGKTTIAKNLAHACRYFGKRVAVVDANTDGNMAEVMDTSYNYTLDHWNQFSDEMDSNTVLGLLAQDVHGVHLLPSGTYPSVFPQTMEKVFRHLFKIFEIVIVDTETKLTPATIVAFENADQIILVGNNNPNIYSRLNVRMTQLTGGPSEGLCIPKEKIDVVINLKNSIDVRQVERILSHGVAQTFDYEDKVEKGEHARKSTYFDLPKTKFAKNMRSYGKSLLEDVGYTEPKKRRWF